LKRSGATAGDLLFVSGTLGEAAAALAIDRGELDASSSAAAAFRRRLEYPDARVALGRALRGTASACIDVSDGLAADASHLARANGCGVTLDLDSLPLAAQLVEAAGVERSRRWALTGGEDYELLFAVPPAAAARLRAAASGICDIAQVGVLEAEPGLRLRTAGGVREVRPEGHDHFGG
jgi:thiamine-monophosphate kinase